MPHPIPRILTLLLATAGLCLTATSAASQTAPAAGRYLTWANRPAGTTPADVVSAQASAQASVLANARANPRNAMIPRRVAPSQSPYQPMMQTAASNVPASRGLTPASAWIGPRVTPAYAPGSPDPVGDATSMAAPVERAASAPQPIRHAAVDPMAPRRDAPLRDMPHPPREPIDQPTASQALVQQPIAAADTMAPRQDARIFQIQQGQPQGTPQASVQSGSSGARYYSVHREAGHRPDPTVLPEPVYFDSVTLDLAEPPAEDLPLRDPQGRRRVVPNEDPNLP